MNILAFAFAYPPILLALLALPLIWWLLRATPPKPKTETFPPTRLLLEITPKEEEPARTPWWLILLRCLIAAARQGGLDEVYLHAQTRVVGFYENFGFVPEGDEFDEAGIPHRLMRRRLAKH